MTLLLFLVGLAILVMGAQALVRGASRLALAAGVSPLVIGLTVVTFGTASPETAVSIKAAWSGQPDLALGNVIGSNLVNILFILGLASVIRPLPVSQQLIRRDVPLMILVSGAVWLMAADGRLVRWEGLVLVAGIAAYTLWSILAGRSESGSVEAQYEGEYGRSRGAGRRAWVGHAALLVVGMVLLVIGSRWLVNGAVVFARVLGVSEMLIGLTIVAVGTSLPELATSLLTTLRGERDISVGNLVGSFLFNLLLGLGLAAIIAPGGIPVGPEVRAFDLPLLVGVAFACLPIFYRGHVIARWEGAIFLFYYAAYLVALGLRAAGHPAAATFRTAAFVFLGPLVLITLGVLAWRNYRAGRRRCGR